MIHHTDLLRTNSDGERFSAPVGNYLNEVDCGIGVLPCLNKCLKLERCAKFGVFVTVLSLVGFFHGAVLNYFRGTSHIWSSHYNIPHETIEWLLYTNEVFVGLFALNVAYWGNRIHRASWMGGLTMLLAVAAITLAAPEFYKPLDRTEIDITGPVLCNNRSLTDLKLLEREFDVITLIIILFFQLLFAMATVSFITHGITYIDDNISPKHSPGFIGLPLAAVQIGKQAGIYFSWAPYVIKIESIFISPVWIILSILTFIIGIIIAMFPKILPSIVMKKSVNSLLCLASGNQVLEEEETIDGFFVTLWRLLKNKVLLINIFALVLIESALINFSILQQPFNQSKYHVSKHNDLSGYSDPALIQFTTNLLKQPLVAISIITTGMVLAKMRPKAKYLVIWNIVVFLLIAVFFSSAVFWNCAGNIHNEHQHSITIPYCSYNCGCSLHAPFHPVCVDKKTYFSPCLAGCQNFSSVHNIYRNCSCGTTVTEGSCDAENCNMILALSQTNSVISSGLLATTVVSNIVINMRCVQAKDKAFALGLSHTFLGIIPYVPIRLIYQVIADNFCEIHGGKGCQFFSEYFPIFVSTTTIFLMVSAAVLAIVLLFFIGNLELFVNTDISTLSDVEINTIRPTPANEVATNETDNVENIDSTVESGEEDSGVRFLRKGKQMSDSKIHSLRRNNKEDRMKTYLSEGQLVPPLKTMKNTDASTSKTSANSGLSSESLRAIANSVGDDHDSVAFSEPETDNVPEKTYQTPRKVPGEVDETEF